MKPRGYFNLHFLELYLNTFAYLTSILSKNKINYYNSLNKNYLFHNSLCSNATLACLKISKK